MAKPKARAPSAPETFNGTTSYDYSEVVGSTSPEAVPQSIPELVKLIETLHAAEEEVARLSEELSRQKKHVQYLAETVLPEALDACHLASFVTPSGLSVSVKDDIQLSLSAERKSAAYAWLEANGEGGLLKTELVIPFAADSEEEAEELTELLEDKGYDFQKVQDVHAQTLKAWVRGKLADGANLPLELFGVRQYRKVTIKETK